MQVEYFDATITDMESTTEEKRIYRRCGFLWLTREFVEAKMIAHHYLICKIEGTNFLFKIEVIENVFTNASVGASLSIMLAFEYKYSAFHFGERKEKESIYQVRDKCIS